MNTTLPNPTTTDKEKSQYLVSATIDAIRKKGGSISFANYMQMALYTKEIGYYTSNLPKFGSRGDFVTAPEISPLFSRCLAKQCQSILETLRLESSKIENSKDEAEKINILEIGAGSGKMAADLLLSLKDLNTLPTAYYILELSENLKQRQRETLASLIPDFLSNIHWITECPSEFKGIILANEVLDAMPVHLFSATDTEISEIKVIEKENQLALDFFKIDTINAKNNFFKTNNDKNINNVNNINVIGLDNNIINFISNMQAELAWPSPYYSEINLGLQAWLSNIAQNIKQGVFLLIDYGFPRHEYYHPDRHQGTLMCHYQHYAHTNPLWHPGLQDITAHVDFTAVAEAAMATGLAVLGFTNQAAFLLNCGLMDLVSIRDKQILQEKKMIEEKQAIQLLTSPAEMGELFKVMALGKNFDLPLLGFRNHDQRYRL